LLILILMMTETNKSRCLNCGGEFDKSFKFCPYCGQENRELELGFKHILGEFLSANFNIDSKFFITIKKLLFSPALLTSEYLKGKHKKFVSPIRIYLIISLVYFFTLSVTDTMSFIDISSDNSATEQYDEGFMETLSDSLAAAKQEPAKAKSAFKKYVINKLDQLNTRQGKSAFLSSVRENVSKGMFLLMPVTAFVFFLFFRKRHYYYEHLIFVVHLQSVLFVVFTFFILVHLVSDADIVYLTETVLLITLVYLWIKRFYHTTVAGTIWRMTGILIIMGVLLFFFVVLITIVSLLLY